MSEMIYDPTEREIDRLTTCALRHAFHPDYQREAAGRDLARLGRSHLRIRSARRRLGAALDQQWIAAEARAGEALDHAASLLVDEAEHAVTAGRMEGGHGEATVGR
jgi:hypothetical protein